MPATEDAAAQPVRLLYLAGIGRSGSTLLERLLGEVPEVCSLGEVTHLWLRGVIRNEHCGCGTPFLDCPFWREVGRAAFGGWRAADAARMTELAARLDDVNRLPRLIRPGKGAFARDLAEYVAAYHAVYRAAAKVTGARVVVDSSKATSLAYCLRATPAAGLPMSVLHVVRDSRGVAYSWTKTVRRPESTSSENDFMPTFSPARVAVLWSGHNLLIQGLRALGTPVRAARYEDFVGGPREFLADLLQACDIPPDPARLAAAGPDWVELGVSHQVSGNPMRYRQGRIPVTDDQTWRRALPAGQRRVVTALTAPVAGLLGYRPASRPRRDHEPAGAHR